MWIVIFFSLLALLFTYNASKDENSNGLLYAFIPLTILSCIHYDYGNDYMAYYDMYNDFTSYQWSLSDIIDKEVYKNPGWVILCLLFKYLGGFFVLIAAMGIFQNGIIYSLVKNFVPRQWWTLSVFIYLFNYNYYLLNFSMLRQGLAGSICILAVLLYFKNKVKVWIPILLILIAYTIHSMALVFFIGFAFCFFKIKDTKIVGGVFLFLLLAFIIFRDFLGQFLLPFVVLEDFEEYLLKYTERGQVTRLGVIFFLNCLPLFVASFLFVKNRISESQERSFAILTMLGILVVPFSTVALMISRIAIFFSVFSIVGIPVLYRNIEDKNLQKGLVALLAVSTLYQYYDFFTSVTYSRAYETFTTIFSVL